MIRRNLKSKALKRELEGNKEVGSLEQHAELQGS